MSALRKMKEQQAALFKSLKEHVQENERLLCALLCIKASVLTDYGSLQDDYISVLQLQSENRDVIIQTINMKVLNHKILNIFFDFKLFFFYFAARNVRKMEPCNLLKRLVDIMPLLLKTSPLLMYLANSSVSLLS